MFGDKKIKPEKVDLTLSELIEKYVNKKQVVWQVVKIEEGKGCLYDTDSKRGR